MEKAVVTGSFDDIRSSDIRFLEEAARQGELHVFLWSDELVRRLDGSPLSFLWGSGCIFCRPSAMSIRFILSINWLTGIAFRRKSSGHSGTWVVNESNDNHQKRAFCASNGMKYQVVKQAILKEFPKNPDMIFWKTSLSIRRWL